MVALLALVIAACAPRPEEAGIAMRLADLSFDPPQLTVRAGETVRLMLENPDRVPHTFDIAELGVSVRLAPGQSAPLEFEVEESGTYIFFCAVPGHREAGMEGVLVVEP